MKPLRIVLVLVLLAVPVTAAAIWFSLPPKTDLADYAPADAIVYVEFNSLADVARTIQHADAWKAAAPITRSAPSADNRLLRTAARAGIGPVESVLFARAQVALVVIGLNTSEQDD